jgi:hypothetical protein
MWHYSLNGQQAGPMARDTLENLFRNGIITGDTLVWEQGTPDWKPLRETELAALLQIELPAGDEWRLCAYSGNRVRLSETVPLGGYQVANKWKDDAVQYLQQGGTFPRADQPSAIGSANLDLGFLMGRAWSLLKPVLPIAIVLYVLLQVPLILASQWMVADLAVSKESPPDPQVYLPLVALSLLAIPFQATLINLMMARDNGKTLTFSEALLGGLKCVPQVLTTALCILPFYALGCLAICIGTLIVSALHAIATCCAVDRRLHGFSSIQFAWSAMKPHLWLTTGCWLLVAIICSVPTGMVAFATAAMPELKHWLTQGGAVSVLSVTSLFFHAFQWVLYRGLHARASL